MYAIRSYYDSLIYLNSSKFINILFFALIFLFINLINLNIFRITSYNVCYTKLLRPFSDNIMLIINDGATHYSYKIQITANAGYNPTVFLGDFTGNKVNDILVSIDSGGSGGFGYYYIFSFLNNKAQKLFDYELFNKYYNYDRITSYNVCYTKLLRILHCLFLLYLIFHPISLESSKIKLLALFYLLSTALLGF